MRKLIDRNFSARERARWANLGRIGVNAPIRSEPRIGILLVGSKVCWGLEARDKVAETQRPHLIVNDIDNALQLTNPVGRDVRISSERRAAVTYKEGHIALYDRFETKIVVDASIRQQHLLSEG